MIEFLLWTNILFCLLGVSVLLCRRTYLSATLLLACGLLFCAGLCYVDLQALAHPADLLRWRKTGLLLEISTILGFYYYTKTIFRNNSVIFRGPGFWLSVVLALFLASFCIVSSAEDLFFSPDFADEGIVYLTKTGFGIYLGLMVYLVFGLVQLERTLAGLHRLKRWTIKPEIIASGLLIASYALYFSHSLLYRSLNLNYLGLRSFIGILAVSLLIYARFFRSDSGEKLSLSRGIAHRSFVLLIVGGYLIILGAIGEGLRYVNIDNAQPILYALLLIGSLGLAAVFLSERLRRKLKVILHKNFYQSKYDYRDQWQAFLNRVSGGKTLAELQTSILDLFCDTLACKWSSLYLSNPETSNYDFVESFPHRRDWRPFNSQDPLIAKLNEGEWIVNLREKLEGMDESLAASLSQQGAILAVPLIFDEELIGFVVIGEQIYDGEEMTYEDYDLLRMLGRQSAAALQGLRLTEQLTSTRELAAIGKVSTFVLHDLKNQVSGLSLMLDNARSYIEDPEFQQDMLETVDNTVNKMKGLIARLKNLKEKPELVVAPVDLEKVIRDAVTTSSGNVEIRGNSVVVDADEEEIYRVVLNLLVNALEASHPDSPVQVEYGCRNGFAYVNVVDSGCGMSEEFIAEKLFKPFETSKKHGFGIGLYQCKQIIESHQGSIEVESKVGIGTTFKLRLPLAPCLENT